MAEAMLPVRALVELRLKEELARGTWTGVGIAIGPDTDPGKVADYARALAYLDLMEQSRSERSSEPPEAVWAAAAISPVGYRTITSVFLREEYAQAVVDEMTKAGMRYELKRLPINYPESEQS